jgi:hypothetical protein
LCLSSVCCYEAMRWWIRVAYVDGEEENLMLRGIFIRMCEKFPSFSVRSFTQPRW